MAKGRKSRRVGVCTQCRQDKVHCTSEQSFPNPCSHCESRGARCSIDSSFKRTPARQRAREQAAELQRLRQATNPRKVRSASGGGGDDSDDDTAAPGSLECDACGTPFAEDVEPSVPSGFTASLGYNTFADDDIRSRFQVFTNHFHPNLPILSTPLQSDALHKYSPLLFWTIIMISCRHLPLPDPQQEALERDFTALVQKTSSTVPMTLHTIQALLLLCTWPLPALWQFSDPSSLYLHTALAGCGFLNLNRPANKRSYQGGQLADADLQTMSRTWLAVFCVSIWLEGWWGTPTFLKHPTDLSNIEAHISRRGTPTTLASEAAILAIAAKHRGFAIPQLDCVAFAAITDLHIAEVDSVSRRFTAVWTDHSQFTALAVKLQLVVSYVTSRSRDPKWKLDEASSTSHLTIASSFARQLIDIFDSRVEEVPLQDQMPPATKWKTLPKSYHRAVTYAAFFLLRFCCSGQVCREQDRAKSCRSVALARDALRRSSSRIGGSGVGDEPGRAALVIDLLLRHVNAEPEGESLRINDRGGSSVVWDSLRHAYQLRGRPTNRTDLHEFIDPLRAAQHADRSEIEGEELHLPLHQSQSAHVFEDTFQEDFWEDGFLQLTDFDWIDQYICLK